MTGGDVTWVSTPCFVTGGCSYRQLWDLKLLPSSRANLISASNILSLTDPPLAPAPAPALAYSLLASWISVTDLDSSAATVQGASIQVLDLIHNTSSGNISSLNLTNLYDTRWHQGHTGMHVEPSTCTAYYTQRSHSSIMSTPMDPMLPPTANYTYKNFRFNPSFAIVSEKR